MNSLGKAVDEMVGVLGQFGGVGCYVPKTRQTDDKGREKCTRSEDPSRETGWAHRSVCTNQRTDVKCFTILDNLHSVQNVCWQKRSLARLFLLQASGNVRCNKNRTLVPQ